MKYHRTPEIISTVRIVDQQGNDDHIGDRISSVQVVKDAECKRDGTVEFDIRDFPKRGQNTVVRMSLPDLVLAITSATLHRDDES